MFSSTKIVRQLDSLYMEIKIFWQISYFVYRNSATNCSSCWNIKCQRDSWSQSRSLSSMIDRIKCVERYDRTSLRLMDVLEIVINFWFRISFTPHISLIWLTRCELLQSLSYQYASKVLLPVRPGLLTRAKLESNQR